jgi:uncharacterized protein YukE
MSDSPNPNTLQVSPDELRSSANYFADFAQRAQGTLDFVSSGLSKLAPDWSSDPTAEAFATQVEETVNGAREVVQSAVDLFNGTSEGIQSTADLFQQSDDAASENAIHLSTVL